MKQWKTAGSCCSILYGCSSYYRDAFRYIFKFYYYFPFLVTFRLALNFTVFQLNMPAIEVSSDNRSSMKWLSDGVSRNDGSSLSRPVKIPSPDFMPCHVMYSQKICNWYYLSVDTYRLVGLDAVIKPKYIAFDELQKLLWAKCVIC